MKLVVIGCGRVGSAVARDLAEDGWDVTAVDEQEEALARLGPRWSGGFVVGHGMDAEILRRAGVPDADAVVVATDGDNTNLVIGQVVEKRYAVPCVVVRVLDPARAEFYAARGMRTVCPTQTAISALADGRPQGDAGRVEATSLMYAIVAGGGKVGANVARSLLAMGHEVTLIEQRPYRFEQLQDEFEHQVLLGDATELHVLERAGIARPPELVLGVTGDDEDNLIICQIASEGYRVPKVIARVNDPRNQEHFDLLGITQTVCATSNVLGLVEHEVPEHGIVHLLELRKENLEIVELQIDRDSPAAGKRVAGLALPDGTRLISVDAERPLRARRGLDRAPARRPGAGGARARQGGRAPQRALQALAR